MTRKIEKQVEKYDVALKRERDVQVWHTGNVVELQALRNRNTKATVKWLDKVRYVVLSTGEIRESEINITRTRDNSVESLRRSFKRMRRLINNNWLGEKNEFFLTLTYAKKEFDKAKLAKDLNNFNMRLRRWAEEKHYGEIGFVHVMEPHADGSWHVHTLLKFLDRARVFIPNEFVYLDEKDKKTNKHKKSEEKRTFEEILAAKVDAPLFDLWGHGFVHVERLNEVSNVAQYVTAYVTNVSVEEIEKDTDGDVRAYFDKYGIDEDTVEQAKTGEKKSVVKGGRLHFYKGFSRIFSHSRNLKVPQEQILEYGEIMQKFDLKPENMTYRSALKVTVTSFEDGVEQDKPFVQTIVQESYNRKEWVENNYLTKQRTAREFKRDLGQAIGQGDVAKKGDRTFASMVYRLAELEIGWFHYHEISQFKREGKDWQKRRALITEYADKRFKELQAYYYKLFGIEVVSV